MSGSALTKDLIGPALDWAVAKCEGREWHDNAWKCLGERHYFPSTDWSQGGPISEREEIGAAKLLGVWTAALNGPNYKEYYGPTELIAKMRCYVASKLGDEVEIPEELK